MEEIAERIAELIKKQIDEVLTEGERVELQSWLAQSDENRIILGELTDRQSVASKLEQFEQYDKEKSWGKLIVQCFNEQTPVIPIKKRKTWMWAAAAILILVTGYLMLVPRFARNDKSIVKQEERFKNDVPAPTSNKATLTLEDGRVIVLDSAGNGELAMQDGSKIIKQYDQLNYEKVLRSAQDDNEVHFNTLTIPKGSKPVQLRLADGTEVWLDAATSITYPTVFVGNERKVEMSGQAYFEVAHNSTMPFFVEKGNVTIEVLGTHFNVKAFDDEDLVSVTLLEGSINVTSGDMSKVISPGQQAKVPRSARNDNQAIVVSSNLNIEEVMAWKNGKFNFRGAKIETIMKEIARWYDVEVIYEARPTDEFVAPISRDVPISKLLKLLELTNKVHFRIEGKKVTVLN